MDISCQEQPLCHSYIVTSSVQPCTRDVHRDLLNGNTGYLKQWLLSGKSARYFVKRAISYPYRVRYEIMNTLCEDLVKTVTLPHPGFYYLGHKSLYEWTYLEIVERCRRSVMFSEQDEIWAFHIISRGCISGLIKQEQWETIIHTFDGSSRWVRLLAAFLCSASHTVTTSFNRYHMVNGWYEWMNAERKYELLCCIYPTFRVSSLSQMNDGEALMMGLIWICKYDDPVIETTKTSNDPYINNAIYKLFSNDTHTLVMPDDEAFV